LHGPTENPRQDATPNNVDDAYTAKMKKYTTAPYFTSPLVDYLPASKTVPTPEVVLGDVAARREFFRTPRSLQIHAPAGKGEPARQVISDRHDGRRPRNDCGGRHLGRKPAEARRKRARLAKLPIRARSTPTTPKRTNLVAQSTPVYYITERFIRRKQARQQR